jgi:hypothetical protein
VIGQASIPEIASRRDAPSSAFERALLPWETAEEFEVLRSAYHREHAPRGATETALVDQLAWIEWRRRRLVAGERAVHMAALQDRLSAPHKTSEALGRALIASGGKADKEELAGALSTSPQEDAAVLADTRDDEAMTQRAIALLETGDPDSYGEALATLRQDTRDWWEDTVSDDEQTHLDGKARPGRTTNPTLVTAISCFDSSRRSSCVTSGINRLSLIGARLSANRHRARAINRR